MRHRRIKRKKGHKQEKIPLCGERKQIDPVRIQHLVGSRKSSENHTGKRFRHLEGAERGNVRASHAGNQARKDYLLCLDGRAPIPKREPRAGEGGSLFSKKSVRAPRERSTCLSRLMDGAKKKRADAYHKTLRRGKNAWGDTRSVTKNQRGQR